MNGVTGRMGTNQHLIRSIDAIIKQGGVHVAPDGVIMPDPILVGRNEAKLKALVESTSATKFTTDLDSVMQDPDYPVYFDAQTTLRRYAAVKQAAEAGKHVYCEKPTAIKTEGGREERGGTIGPPDIDVPRRASRSVYNSSASFSSFNV